MDVNPYQSPEEIGYSPPRQRSGWWDFLACVVTASLVFPVLIAAILAVVEVYEASGLNWSRQFRAAGLIFFGTALLVYAAGFARLWWRRRKQVRRLTWPESPMRFRLRTLMIVLAILPPLLAGVWWMRNWHSAGAVALWGLVGAAFVCAVIESLRKPSQ